MSYTPFCWQSPDPYPKFQTERTLAIRKQVFVAAGSNFRAADDEIRPEFALLEVRGCSAMSLEQKVAG
jgi:hypothetical protein